MDIHEEKILVETKLFIQFVYFCTNKPPEALVYTTTLLFPLPARETGDALGGTAGPGVERGAGAEAGVGEGPVLSPQLKQKLGFGSGSLVPQLVQKTI